MKKVIIVSIIGTIVCAIIFLNKFTTQPLKNNNILTVGIAANYAPWISINQNGDYEGFDIDIINALGKELNKKIILKDLGSMSSLFIALEQEKVDALIWGLSITPDRLKKMIMVRYQGDEVNSFPLLFWQKLPETMTSLESLNGKTVCVEPGSSQDTVLQNYPNIKKIYTEKIDDALLTLQFGKAEAAFVEPAIAKKYCQKFPEIKRFEIQLPSENQVKGVGICIKLNQKMLATTIEDAVKKMEQKGLIKAFEDKWVIRL